MADKNFINGIFANKKTFSNGGYIINLAISDDAIAAIQALPKDAKGWRQVAMGEQKKDANKYSVWQNDFVPTKKNGGSINNNAPEETENDLPF